jgi:hypothetical protein
MNDVIVSCIVPYVQEWPQIAFTLRAIHTELRGIPHEVVAVDNMCPYGLLQQWGLGRRSVEDFLSLPEDERATLYEHQRASGRVRPLDKGHDRPKGKDLIHPPTLEDWYGGQCEVDESHFKSWARKHDWLQYVHYDQKLSHWNAKTAGIGVARGRLLYFVDGHVAPGDGSMRLAVELYEDWTAQHGPGSFHSPLTYHIMEDHRLIYRLVWNEAEQFLSYSFSGYPAAWDQTPDQPREVPCMSLCGMLTSRELIERVGGFPRELGIYGGGENWWNFCLSVIGGKKWVVPGNPLHHYGNTRGYHWLDGDLKRNRALAAWCYGGEEYLSRYCRGHRSYTRQPAFFERLIPEVMESCAQNREIIAAQQVKEIGAWIAENS